MEDGGTKHTREFEKKSYDIQKLLQSEDPFEVGIAMRMLSHEYGTVTGRPRRMGAFDIAQLRDVVADNGIDEIYLTKADLLQCFAQTKRGTIPVVTGYTIARGEEPRNTPVTLEDFAALQPEYTTYQPFSGSLAGIKRFEEFPAQLKELLHDIEKRTGARVVGVGTGPRRDELVLR